MNTDSYTKFEAQVETLREQNETLERDNLQLQTDNKQLRSRAEAAERMFCGYMCNGEGNRGGHHNECMIGAAMTVAACGKDTGGEPCGCLLCDP
jgi:hypothetical protein